MLRRVVGDSMLPTLKPGQLVVGSKKFKPKPGSLVIVKYGDREIIKRLKLINENELFVLGDNEQQSSDSRHFGWISKKSLLATVIWPIN